MTDPTPNGTPSSTSSMLVMEAFEHVRIDQLKKYESMGALIDDQVKATEPGMLIHALTKISETKFEAVYRWLEVFESAAALEAHLCNPPVVSHIEAMNSGVLAGPTELVIYSDWNDDQKGYWREKLAGAKLTFAPLITGFFLPK